MKTNRIAMFFFSLFVLSAIGVGVGLIYQKMQIDQGPIIKVEKRRVDQKMFNTQELNLITYRKNGQHYFYKDYFEYLILNYLSKENLKLINSDVSFQYDDLENPTSAKVLFNSDDQEIWNYSII